MKTTKFEVGKQYYMNSPCDQSCIWEYEVVKRTEKSIWLKPVDEEGKIKRCKVTYQWGEEWAKPLGSYSMCPMLHSNKEIL